MSSRGTRTSTPFTEAMRSPSTIPARSAGPSSTTDVMNRPSVSRMLLDAPTETPMAARSRSGMTFGWPATRTRSPSSSDWETVFTLTERETPPRCTRRSTSSPASSLASARCSRRWAIPTSSGSAASTAPTRRLTPFTSVMTSPGLMPAFAAGLSARTSEIVTPLLSARLSSERVTPSTARFTRPMNTDIP